MSEQQQQQEDIKHTGGCHCGAIRYEVLAPKNFEAVNCNCSICTKKGIIHLIVTKDKFKLLQGEDKLSLYTFNTHVAKHYFCSKCGICPYYIARSHPDDIDVNARSLDDIDISKINIKDFDGKNWESQVHKLDPAN